MNRKLQNESLGKGTHKDTRGARQRMDIDRSRASEQSSAQGLTSIIQPYKYSAQ